MIITIGDIFIYFSCYFGLFTSFYFLISLYDNKNNLVDKKITVFPMVSVVVPAYNEEKTLAKTLNSLLDLDYPKEKLEIIIVDDGSSDKTWEIAQEFEKKHSQIVAIHQTNSGKGKALNNAISICKGEFVGALDADSFVDKNALRCIISRFDDPNTMSVTPSMKIANPTGFLPIIQEIEYMLGIFLRKIFSFMNSIHVTPGPFSIFRKSFFEKHGGYDENNLTEDIEIALRIHSNGYFIDNALGAFVYTVCPTKFVPLMKQRLRWYYGFFQNIFRYKHLFSSKKGNLGLILLPSALISIAISIGLLIHTSWIFSKSAILNLKSLYYLKLDYFRYFNFSFDSFTLFNELTFLGLITLFVSIFIIIIANRFSGKNKNLIFHYIIFTMFYWLFYSFWWLVAIFYTVTGKKLKWGQRTI